MTDQPKCATCRFHDSGMDECRRRAPTMLSDDTQAVAMWPTTVATEWCGEHEAVPDQAQQPRALNPEWRAGLSTRAKNCLDSEGSTDDEIIALTSVAPLLRIRNMGKTTAYEILDKCREAYGLPPHGKR